MKPNQKVIVTHETAKRLKVIKAHQDLGSIEEVIKQLLDQSGK